MPINRGLKFNDLASPCQPLGPELLITHIYFTLVVINFTPFVFLFAPSSPASSSLGLCSMARFLSGLACGLALAQSIGAAVIDQELDEGIPDTGLDTSSWTTGVLPNISDLFTLNDFQIAAKNTMAPGDYAQYRTGTLDETSMKAL